MVAQIEQLRRVLEAFLQSDGWKEGAIQSTKAGWENSHYLVDLFPTGSWDVLLASRVNPNYRSPGIVLRLPQIPGDVFEGVDEYAYDLGQAFDLVQRDLEDQLRADFEKKAAALAPQRPRMGRPPVDEEQRRQKVDFMIEPFLRRKVERLAERRHLTFSKMVRELIIDALERTG